jgi:hypothetical protein
MVAFAGVGEAYENNALCALSLSWATRGLTFFWETGLGTNQSWTSSALWTAGYETGDYEIHHIAFVRKPNPITAFSKRAIRFIEAGEYLDAGNVLGFERTAAFSVSCWFKSNTNAGSFVVLVAKMGDGTAFQGWQLAISNGALYFALINDNGAGDLIAIDTNTITYRDGAWHHVVVTYDGTSLASGVTFYVDGSSAAATAITDNLTASIVSTDPLRIGARASSGSEAEFPGVIDEVAVYDKELSSAEVTAIYNSGRPNDLSLLGSSTNLQGWWRMGDGDTVPTILDQSGNAYHATMGGITMGERSIVGEVPGVLAAVEVYVDGSFVDGVGNLGQPDGGWEGFWSTGGSSGSIFRVDDIRISDRARTATEILESYNSGFVDFAKDLYYKMRALDDPGPGYVTWVVSTFPDFTGNQAPGPIQAGTAIVAAKWEAIP